MSGLKPAVGIQIMALTDRIARLFDHAPLESITDADIEYLDYLWAELTAYNELLLHPKEEQEDFVSRYVNSRNDVVNHIHEKIQKTNQIDS